MAAEEPKLERDSYVHGLEEKLPSFTDQQPAGQPVRLQKSALDHSSLVASGKDRGSGPVPPSQPSVGDETLGSSFSKARSPSQGVEKDVDGGTAHPKNTGLGLHTLTDSALHKETRMHLLTGEESIHVGPAVPRKLPNPKLEKEEREDTQGRRKICLSSLEKQELSRLSPTAVSFNFSGMRQFGTEKLSFNQES